MITEFHLHTNFIPSRKKDSINSIEDWNQPAQLMKHLVEFRCVRPQRAAGQMITACTLRQSTRVLNRSWAITTHLGFLTCRVPLLSHPLQCRLQKIELFFYFPSFSPLMFYLTDSSSGHLLEFKFRLKFVFLSIHIILLLILYSTRFS